MLEKDERGRERMVLCSREVRRALVEKGLRHPSPVHHPSPALACKRGGEEADGGGREAGGGSKEAGGCGKIPIIVTNLTVGPDACRGWAICFR